MALVKHTKILTVFSFLQLRSPDIYWYQWIYPSMIFGLGYGIYLFGGQQWFSVDQPKMIDDVNSLMGILVGFYIAALAAVSTFNNASLDQIMKGRAPTLIKLRQGEKNVETLTRRRFLSVLFGYCACLSIILYIFGVVQAHVTADLPHILWLQTLNDWAHSFAWACYLWLLSSLLVVTLLGLHYLVERMHRP